MSATNRLQQKSSAFNQALNFQYENVLLTKTKTLILTSIASINPK
jgi:hypothetical protein